MALEVAAVGGSYGNFFIAAFVPNGGTATKQGGHLGRIHEKGTMNTHQLTVRNLLYKTTQVGR